MKESRTDLNAIVRHVALPAAAPVAIIGLYFTPVLLFGCVNRGLLALAIVVISAIAACVTTGKGVRAKAQGLPSANLWLLSTLILVMPIALVLGPLG
jgi:choline-glycine betaine transporter